MDGKVTDKRTIILVVDDEADLVAVIADELDLHGFTVLRAEGKEQALKLLASHKVDMIISDVRMPDGDGIEFFETVKSTVAKDIPFVFMTGFPDLSVREATKKGAFALILKPFHLSELVETIKKGLLGSRS